MSERNRDSLILSSFARLLDYPAPHLPETAATLAALLSSTHPETLSPLERFQSSLSQVPLSRLEEIYTRTFDMQPVCHPYVGYQLFGESYQRGEFMIKLREEYRKRGFIEAGELPDHLCVILQFLAGQEEEPDADLLDYGLIPALAKMEDHLKGSDNPYGGLLQGLLSFLRGKRESPD